MKRLLVFVELLLSMRRREFRSARTWIGSMYPGKELFHRLLLFFAWSIKTMWHTIPNAVDWVQYERPVSTTPLWLRDTNPLENHPWQDSPDSEIPEEAEVVVIGAGFTGAGAAYHWSKHGKGKMIVLEMNDAASGSGGRNAGFVTMGRYYHYVHGTVFKNLERSRPEMSAEERVVHAHEFARPYVVAGIKSNQMIEQTIADEGIDCDYVKKGWVWTTDEDSKDRPRAAQVMGEETGFTDWTRISKEEAMQKAGIKTDHDAGHSQGTANWHPAKWIWGLFQVALKSPTVEFYSRTKVNEVKDVGEYYDVHTDRGSIKARHVINATESHTPSLFKRISQHLEGRTIPGCFWGQ